jgi:hypothetical protein
MIEANSPEIALVKANRMGDLGWSIVDELSAEEYCYRITKAHFCSETQYNEITDILYNYFKARREDRLFDAYLYVDEFENITGLREHDDIINYVINNY